MGQAPNLVKFKEEGQFALRNEKGLPLKQQDTSILNTGLTVVQVEKLLSLIAANCPMESLNLSANMLSMVETELMAQAINKLKDVTLIDTNLSVNQVLRIDHIS